MAFLSVSKERFPSGHSAIETRWSPHTESLELSHIDHLVVGHLSLTEALPLSSPRMLSLAGWPALGRVLVVPNFFHLRIMEATVLLGNFNTDILYSLPQICASTQSCL